MAWICVSTKVDTHQEQATPFQPIAEPVEGGVGPVAGVSAASMPRPSPHGEVTPESWTVGSNGRLGLFPVLYRAQALQFQSDALLVVVLDVLHEPSLQTLDAVKAVQVEKF